MGPTRKPGTVCGHNSPVHLHDGTMCLAESPVPSRHDHRRLVPSHHGGLVTGKKEGVKQDILDYLAEVAKFFGTDIYVNDGKRSAEDQAKTMFKHWLKLSRGEIYKPESLPKESRLRMDNFYKIAKETPAATKAQRDEATAKFLEEGRKVKSRHIVGDAVDLIAPQISKPMRQALEMRLKHVHEGKNPSCYHLQRKDQQPIPQVDDALRDRWQHLRDAHEIMPVKPIFWETAPNIGDERSAYLC